MTVYSPNIRIPHLDQNVAQPEIPENTAKNIIDSFLSSTYQLETVDALDITISHTDSTTAASSWQSFIIEVLDTGAFLTGTINVNLPINARPYIFKNSTAYAITFKTVSGTGFSLASVSNAYAYSDGTNIEKLEFAASGAGTTFDGLTDTPGNKTGSGGKIAVVNTGETDIEYTSTITGITIKDYGETSQAVTSSTNTMTIDLASGNVVTYTAIETSAITLSTTHTNTSFTMLATNFGAFVQTWVTTVLWQGGTEPTWSTSGVDLITFTKVGSTWIAGALIGVA